MNVDQEHNARLRSSCRGRGEAREEPIDPGHGRARDLYTSAPTRSTSVDGSIGARDAGSSAIRHESASGREEGIMTEHATPQALIDSSIREAADAGIMMQTADDAEY